MKGRILLGIVAAAVGLIGMAALSVVGPSASVEAASWGDKEISAKALDDHGCNPGEWHFVITQVKNGPFWDKDKYAPSHINVIWANGATQQVSLDKYTGKTAHYTTYSNLGSVVTSATAKIYGSWGGQFNLSHGPCLTPTPTPTATPTPTSTPTSTPTPTTTPTVTPTPTPTVMPTPAPTATPTPTTAPTATPAYEATPTATPEPTTASQLPTSLPVTGGAPPE